MDGCKWFAKVNRPLPAKQHGTLFTALVTVISTTLAATHTPTLVATLAPTLSVSLAAFLSTAQAGIFVTTLASTLGALLTMSILATFSVVQIVDLAKKGVRCLVGQRPRHAAAGGVTCHGRCNKMPRTLP